MKTGKKLIHSISRLLIFALLVTVIPAGASSASVTETAPVVYAAVSEEERAEQILSEMTTSEKIAQMMVVAMPASDAAAVQKKYQFGGYILFARDFARTNKKGMRKLLKSCQTASEVPMLIGTDEEGGTVVRASLYRKYRSSRFRSPREVYRSGKYEEIVRDTKEKDAFLKSLRLNCNFSPVADVPYRKSNFMYDRAFSTKAKSVSKFIKLTVTRMGKDNVVSTLKHFPGYGNNGDTHGKIIRDKRSRKTFEKRDLKPFKSGIKAGADMIMVSHTIVNAFDKKRPASLSPKVISYLRNDMGFEGVIITDGLGMKGVTDFVGGDQGAAAVKAIKAGNDMICATGNYKACYKALKKAVKDGKIPKKQIDKSVKRILIMKIRRGIIK